MDTQTYKAKKFSPQGLTHSAAHHLLAVEDALSDRGYARGSDIARRLGTTRGSVSVSMRALRTAGYLEQDERHFFRLTPLGQRAVASLHARHEVVERFLTDILELPADQAHRQSCRIENLVGAAMARRLHVLLEFWKERDLSGELTRRLEPACPLCREPDTDRCPCCGLECLEDACPLDLRGVGQGGRQP
ncbi:MAG TPA: hypothetical protein DCX07_08020 [Phycisphaerales bacterium]|nr:hypothetical protein [Phycisphaerales bacterium]